MYIWHASTPDDVAQPSPFWDPTPTRSELPKQPPASHERAVKQAVRAASEPFERQVSRKQAVKRAVRATSEPSELQANCQARHRAVSMRYTASVYSDAMAGRPLYSAIASA